MSWHALPAELHLAVVALLPAPDVRALAATAHRARALALPVIFANVTLHDAAALHAFAAHVPPAYGLYVRSLAIATTPGATGARDADTVLDVLHTCPRLLSLALALASSIDPEKAVHAFARLPHIRSLAIESAATEDVAPVSERLVVALAASLPALSHLALSRITRSAIHVDPCDVPYGVPLVTNDFDVPASPVFGSDLALPNLLRLPSLRSLHIRDTWLGCDSKIVPATCPLHSLLLTGSMYSSDALASAAWLSASPALCSLHIGTSLVPPSQPVSLPHVSHVHIDASRVPVHDLVSTLDALKPCRIESISIAYEHARPDDDLKHDEFARECALDDLQDWSDAVDAFLSSRSNDDWTALALVQISFAPDVHASWAL